MFEIKVAFVGYVSVGKSTIINGLLQDSFTEVALSRTTAGVNCFRIYHDSKKEQTDTTEKDKKNSTDKNGSDIKTADSVLKEIQRDNKLLRESGQVKEKVFHIKLDKPLCEMRDDTTLVLVDIPGINEAETSNKYKEYVSDKWDTFDCVVVVMDALQGVNTEEQVGLLRFVKQNNDEKKQVPIIVLANKFDDPDAEEQQAQVKQAKEKTFSIFKNTKRKRSATNKSYKTDTIFIPISARNAFVYRCASRLSFDEFKKLDADIIDKLGREEMGKIRWKRLSNEKKFEVAYGAVSKESEYKERLAGTNFDKLLSVLCDTVGGKERQNDLIGAQQMALLNHITFDNDDLVELFGRIYSQNHALGKPSDHLATEFWRLFNENKEKAFQELRSSPNVSILSKPMNLLLRCKEHAQGTEWVNGDDINKEIAKLVREQINLIIEKSKGWNMRDWYYLFNDIGWKAVENEIRWEHLSPHDWHTIIGSVLLLASERRFYEQFGPQKLQLELELAQYTPLMLKYGEIEVSKELSESICPTNGRRSSRGRGTKVPHYYEEEAVTDSSRMIVMIRKKITEAFEGKYDEEEFKYDNVELYNAIVKLKIPQLLSDESHWGNIAWRFCQESDK